MTPRQAYIHSILNRKDLEKVEKCSCYFCVEVFPAKEIVEWMEDGETAICPRCGVDAILPGEISKKDLVKCCKAWFTKPSTF